MNPLLIALGARALKFLLASSDLRGGFSATLASERHDVGPEVVAALAGDAEAIALLDRELDEAIVANRGIVSRLEDQVRREAATRLDS